MRKRCSDDCIRNARNVSETFCRTRRHFDSRRHSRAFSSKTSDLEQVYVAVYMLAIECKGNRSNMLGGRFASFLGGVTSIFVAIRT